MAQETQTISKLIISIGGTDYELDGGGGSGPLGPNTVGTEQIIDGAVEMEDLHDDVVDKMTNTYHKDEEKLTLGSLNVSHASTQPTTPSQPMVVEEEEEP